MATGDLVFGVNLGTTCFKAALFAETNTRGDAGLGRVTVQTEERAGVICELGVDRFWRSLGEAVAQARVQTLSDYLVYALTGAPVGDQGTAALLGLGDLSAANWWAEGLQAAAIRPEQLSQPLPPGSGCGSHDRGGGERLGLPAGIPLAVGSLDHHAAAIGAGSCAAPARAFPGDGGGLPALPAAACSGARLPDGSRYPRVSLLPVSLRGEREEQFRARAHREKSRLPKNA